MVEQELLTLPEHLSLTPVLVEFVLLDLLFYVCVFWGSLFVRLLGFFFWTLCCLFFFDERILVVPLEISLIKIVISIQTIIIWLSAMNICINTQSVMIILLQCN